MSEEKKITPLEKRVVFSNIAQPSYVRPKIEEQKNGSYQTYGADNKYPEYLLNIYFGSSQHQGIIQRKVDEIVGNGLYSATNNADITAFIKRCNNKGQTLNDIYRKCSNDEEIFGGFALQIIYGKGSQKGSPIIAELYYIDIGKLRWNKDYTKLKYSKNWQTGKIKTITYDLYDENNPTGTKIFYYSGTMTRDFYPIPEYIGSIPAIETAIDIANFNQNTLRNGFFPSVSITFHNGEPTEEEKGFIEKSIQEKWGGTSNTGRFMLTFADKDDDGPTITPIQQPDLDKRFAELKTSVIEDIFIGHRITNPAMFGLQVPGKLGGASEYTQSYAIFQNVFVKPKRRVMLGVLNSILDQKFKQCDLEVLELEPVNNVFSDEALIASQMSQPEIRTLLVKWGYIESVALPPEQKTIVETDINDPAAAKTSGDTTAEPSIKPAPPRVKLNKKLSDTELEELLSNLSDEEIETLSKIIKNAS